MRLPAPVAPMLPASTSLPPTAVTRGDLIVPIVPELNLPFRFSPCSPRWAPPGHVMLADVAALEAMISHLDDLLEADSFDDYGPNGLQVPGAAEVGLVATGVSAHRE